MFLLSFTRVTRVNLGIQTDDVIVAHVRPGAQGLHHGSAQSGLEELQVLTARVRSMPGVQAAALAADNLPFSGSSSGQSISVPGYVGPTQSGSLTARIARVSPEYFGVLGIRTLSGRVFNSLDGAGAPAVVVLSERATRAFFPGRDPIGQIVDTAGPLRVIGVVSDVRDAGPEATLAASGQLIYVPLAQAPSPGAVMLVRTEPRRLDLTEPIASAIQASYPDLALVPVRPLSDYLRPYFDQRRFNMVVIATFAVLGIAIACVGVNGVSAFVVVQRTKEIGIRRALGGSAASVIWSVLRGTTAHVVIGVGIGVLAALYLAGFGKDFLFQVEPRDPWLYAGAALLFGGCALLAAFAPARRAARVEAATVLRCD
jgi:predicted permease